MSALRQRLQRRPGRCGAAMALVPLLLLGACRLDKESPPAPKVALAPTAAFERGGSHEPAVGAAAGASAAT